MTLSIEVETARVDAALVLPQSALRAQVPGNQAEVLVVQDGRAEPRRVRLGLRTLGAVEVLEGLADGDTVLRRGSAAAGGRVRPKVVDWQPAAAPLAAKAEEAGGAMANAMGR